MEMDDIIRAMEERDGQELIDQFMRERPRFLYYEGSLSLLERGSSYGVRLDGVNRGDSFPEDCLFIDEIVASRFFLREGQWTERGNNRFRIIIERVDWADE